MRTDSCSTSALCDVDSADPRAASAGVVTVGSGAFDEELPQAINACALSTIMNEETSEERGHFIPISLHDSMDSIGDRSIAEANWHNRRVTARRRRVTNNAPGTTKHTQASAVNTDATAGTSGKEETKPKKKPNPAVTLLTSRRAITTARKALEALGEGEVGPQVGIAHMATNTVTHCFEANVEGYVGWQWHAVLACAPGATDITVSEVALMPGGQALQAPEWVPYYQRVRPGDLGPGDVLPPPADDERLHKGKLSTQGASQAAQRWIKGDLGPHSEYAKAAEQHCNDCAFYVSLKAPMEKFGACTNEFAFDAQVVASNFGCGAHSKTEPAELLGGTEQKPFDDEAPLDFVL